MLELLMGASLADFLEAEALKPGDDLARLEYGDGAHTRRLATRIVSVPTNSASGDGSPSSSAAGGGRRVVALTGHNDSVRAVILSV